MKKDVAADPISGSAVFFRAFYLDERVGFCYF